MDGSYFPLIVATTTAAIKINKRWWFAGAPRGVEACEQTK